VRLRLGSPSNSWCTPPHPKLYFTILKFRATFFHNKNKETGFPRIAFLRALALHGTSLGQILVIRGVSVVNTTCTVFKQSIFHSQSFLLCCSKSGMFLNGMLAIGDVGPLQR
jgi:hypothetical protein